MKAAKLAKEFINSQMAGFALVNAIDGALDIDWVTYYRFSAGVYDVVSFYSEKQYGYDNVTSIAILPYLFDGDLDAATKLVSALKVNSEHRAEGAAQMQKLLKHEQVDPFALARCLGARCLGEQPS
jgi:hypothetical protein